MPRNRRSNLAFAARSAASASTSSLRARLAAANNRSPTSSKIADAAPGSCAPFADAFRGRVAHLVEFFGHLIRGLAGVFPIEAHARRALAELEGPHQGRQGPRHAVEMTGCRAALRAALGGLDFLPGNALFSGRHGAACTEHMRVAAQQLVANRAGHRLEVEVLRLAGDLGVKNHLKQQIAQFILEVSQVAALDGVGDFVRLLDGVGRDARKGLLPVPGTAVRGPQPRHDGEQFAHPRHGRDCSMRRRVMSIPAVAPQILRSP